MASIIICDDAVFMRMTIREILESAGHEIVAETDDIEDAVYLFKKYDPDVVTMDLLMRQSGVEGVKQLIAANPNAKIVIVSVLSDQEGEVVEAVKSGASGIVTKPIKRETLLSEIDRVLAQ